ncbi:MAG: hypothetical protein IT240_09805 [Bacteroidia bacterium]|jgi:hypothetical protein|nr:hypothetical protein [Bacteroidia bacterium]MCC6769326.1 hypothetical protein [Bacteroidia bacterium]
MKFSSYLFTCLLSTSCVFAQTDDLSTLLERESEGTDKREFTRATFKTTRIVNGHSIENVSAGVLDFRISHHFGTFERGLYDMIGLDNATIRLGLEYGLHERVMVGLGRSTHEKTIDGFTKIKILRQQEGKGGMPVSLSYLGSAEVKTIAFDKPWQNNRFTSRLYFTHQLLLARKFNERISLQLSPGLVHWNLVPEAGDPNDMLSLGAGGRFKITRRVSLNLEYFYQLPKFRQESTQDAVAIGFDIDTGGHIFQVFITNSAGITERAFITQTLNKVSKGELLLGFCISRVFTLRTPKDFR